ncbi:MAG: RluA family pseudouridine synthase [Anaerolineae bacterium]|nr:RluA family pseudouridine synthase [Anaerolineae bacterium]
MIWVVDQPAPRLDRHVAERCPELSRSQVRRLIDAGAVTVNQAPARPAQKLVAGDLVRVEPPPEPSRVPSPEPMPLAILYEDEHLLALDKPAGLVVHPAPGHPQHTLVNALLAERPDVARADLDPQRPGIVHRLDRDTSGVLLVALSRSAQRALQAQFKARQVDKRYLALVYGLPERSQAVIEAPIGRHPVHRQRMAVLEAGGRSARTEFTMREPLRDASLLEAHLITGRTHQLRVHLAAIGHPVVGDRVYGPQRQRIPAPRQMLHAWRLTLNHPVSDERLELTAPLPADFVQVLERLRRQSR